MCEDLYLVMFAVTMVYSNMCRSLCVLYTVCLCLFSISVLFHCVILNRLPCDLSLEVSKLA